MFERHTVYADVPGPLRLRVCASSSPARAHICVCMKTRPYVGVCLINCESMWETVCLFIWVRDGEMEGEREREQNEEVDELCFYLQVNLLAVTQTS